MAAGGPLLQLQARFDALDQHFRATLRTPSGWLSWPAEFHDPHGTAAARFAAEHSLQIEFYLYLQWLAHEQLAAAQALAVELGMPIGLYGDYAVGAHPSGAETWSDQRSYRLGAEIGAPPDQLALKGQGWGIPPPDPVQMEMQHLQGFMRLVRNNMRCYGALRLDHVMSLFRLWWVAAAYSPTQGAYVHYPLHQLLTVLALESARSSCLVVGEDLGVVPDEMRRAMGQFGLYHYKVLLFEKEGGRFRRPDEFVRRALATVTTHDMPTLRAFWEGRDLDLRQRLKLYPSVEIEHEIQRERDRDREALLAALREQGLEPQSPASPSESFSPQLAHALHLYLARSTALAGRSADRGLIGHGRSRQCTGYGPGISQLATQVDRGYRGYGRSRRLRVLVCGDRPGARLAPLQLPTTSTLNVPSMTGARGRGCSDVGAGTGPNSAATRYARWVCASRAMVRALFCVITVAMTE